MALDRAHRYGTVAIVLHWAIAVCIIAMIPMGLWMTAAIEDPGSQSLAYRMYQWHKAIGFLILALTLARLGWRLLHPVPALPAAMPWWERFAARATHAAFYALMLLIPLTGWIFVSAGWSVITDNSFPVATSWFGLFQVPHLSAFADAEAGARRLAAYRSMGAHSWMSWGAVALILLHAAAAFKHHFVNRDNVLSSMVPGLKAAAPQPDAPKGGVAASIAGTVAIVLLAGVGALIWTPASRLATKTAAPAAAGPTAEAAIVPGAATAWTVDAAKSEIGFAGAHAGNPFKGRFTDWEGHIWFDPAKLADSKAVVLVRTASAKTGDATQEGSLTDPEWFDIKAFPVARFEATSFTAKGGDRYEARGTLRVKRATVPVTLPFTLKIAGDTATVEGEVQVDRAALDMGMVSDPAAEWVTKLIQVKIKVVAKRAG